VCALGFEKQIVGRSHECDYPESVRSLPVCTEPKFDIDGSSAEIDRRVRETLQDSLSVYRVHSEMLREMRPDVIVTQSHCEVCAVSERDVVEAVYSWLDRQPRIVSLKPDRLDDVWIGIRDVAAALDVRERGELLIEELQGRMGVIEKQAMEVPVKPTVACVEWIEPLMASGNWMPRLVEMAGGVNVFGKSGEHSPGLAWERFVEVDPEVIIVLPCGFDRTRTKQEMPFLTRRPEWQDLRAVHNGRVFVTDGNQYFNRPGPRLAESLQILAEILHPAAFRFGHEGSGWERL
jgi:iron complex transport system substrate-binding protein